MKRLARISYYHEIGIVSFTTENLAKPCIYGGSLEMQIVLSYCADVDVDDIKIPFFNLLENNIMS